MHWLCKDNSGTERLGHTHSCKPTHVHGRAHMHSHTHTSAQTVPSAELSTKCTHEWAESKIFAFVNGVNTLHNPLWRLRRLMLLYFSWVLRLNSEFSLLEAYTITSSSNIRQLLDWIRGIIKQPHICSDVFSDLKTLISLFIAESGWRAAEPAEPVRVCSESVCQWAAESPAPGPVSTGQDPREWGQQWGTAPYNTSLQLGTYHS